MVLNHKPPAEAGQPVIEFRADCHVVKEDILFAKVAHLFKRQHGAFGQPLVNIQGVEAGFIPAFAQNCLNRQGVVAHGVTECGRRKKLYNPHFCASFACCSAWSWALSAATVCSRSSIRLACSSAW